MDRINKSLERVTGHARELLLIIKKEIEDAAEAFATGKPPGTGKNIEATKACPNCKGPCEATCDWNAQ